MMHCGELPPNVAALIEFDEHDPGGHDFGDAAENAAYTKQFITGEMTCYSVSLVRADDDGNMIATRSNLEAAFIPEFLGSIGGCDSENGNAEGLYSTLASIPDDYLRSLAAELVNELEGQS